ncbi:MAG: leucine-rich repeat protein, partial [Oscillospiraceae bacterium]|nr:leucine-rich repeat protein [Oscillospiraceae bacterium]
MFEGTKRQWKNLIENIVEEERNEHLFTAKVLCDDGEYIPGREDDKEDQPENEIVASGECGDNAEWTLDENGVLTISGTGRMTNWENTQATPWAEYAERIKAVVVEEGINHIGSNAYLGYAQTVSLPEDLYSIGANAFKGYEGKELVLPSTIESIGREAFAFAENLEYVFIPEYLMDYDYGAFGSCTNLKEIEVDENNETYKSVDGVVYRKDGTELVAVPAGIESKTLTVENGTETIIRKAAWGAGITELVIPATVKVLEENAFQNCSKIETVIYDGTKADWYNVEVNAGNDYVADAKLVTENRTGICGENITWEIDGEGTLTITGTGDMDDYMPESEWSDYPVTPWVDHYANGVRKIVISDGITSIGDYAFFSFYHLESIEIPDSVTEIGNNVFQYCYSLKEIDMPDNLLSIGEKAFFACSELEKLEIPETVEYIGEGAFMYCSSIAVAEIPEGVDVICSNTFNSCYNLLTVVIPKSVTYIGEYAFGNCHGIGNVYYRGTEEEWAAVEVYDDILAGLYINCNYTQDLPTFTVKFNTGVKNIKVDPVTLTEGEKLTSLPNIARKGYIIRGWSKSSKTRNYWTVETDRVYEDITLYAVWDKHTTTKNDLPDENAEGVSWKYDGKGTLTISGKGAMEDFYYDYWDEMAYTPWSDYNNEIRKVIVEKGVTSIGRYAFAYMPELRKVELPEGLEKIGY